MAHSNNKLYNYLVNTFGLSKEIVLEYVNKRLEELLFKSLETKLSSNYVEKLIINQITQIVNNGIDNGSSHFYFREKTKFDDYVKSVIRSVIEEKMNDNYDLQIQAIIKYPKGSKPKVRTLIERKEEE